MGNSYCGKTGRPCNYYIFPNPGVASVEEKQNQLLNYLVGITNQQELLSEISGQGLTPPWNLAYPLIFPPVVQTVYCLNANMTNGSSGQIDPNNTSQCYAIPNPYYEHALILQNAMLGTPVPNFAMPCSQVYTVPFALNNNIQGLGSITFANIQNVPGPNGGGFAACWQNMTKLLETPSLIGGQRFCIGDSGYSPNLGLTVYTLEYLMGPNFLGYAAGIDNPPPLLALFLSNPSGYVKNLFPIQVPVGPYDVSGPNQYRGCLNLTSPTCTNQICHQNQTLLGYLCGPGGKCNPVNSGPPPPFTGPNALQDCMACQANGNCGQNVCCPQSQQPGGVCPTTPPPPPPPSGNYMFEAIVGLILLIIVIVALIYATKKINLWLSSKA